LILALDFSASVRLSGQTCRPSGIIRLFHLPMIDLVNIKKCTFCLRVLEGAIPIYNVDSMGRNEQQSAFLK
jgi:hypothetical protein